MDTSTVEKVKEDGTIVGKSGRTLNIPSAWNNPSGDFHIGLKSVFSLFPKRVCKRLQQEKKEEEWDPVQKVKLAQAVNNLAQFDRKCASPTTDEEKLEHENLTACVEALKSLEKGYKDEGGMCDCVVFHDGEEWKVCVDTTQEGQLDQCQLLGVFSARGEYGRISDKDMVNYSVNVYDDGNVLSIVTNSGSHGTHVACIAAAHFEEEPELNGLAPGAQIISMQIGDCRLNGMETGTAFIRAMKCAIDNKVDVINMSYGESAKWASNGPVFDMIKKMVREHNITFISSAGNDGPALTTVGAPVSISGDIIGVGAYVSPDMMAAEYSLLEKMGGTQYTWSSNGPCFDGKLGVSIVAPGGAVTSVPNWTLSKGQLMNGTSMASPNACGSVAVLMSALKKEGIIFSPAGIRRCLENTALRIDGLSSFVQGHGMVQVDRAFDYMKDASSDVYSTHITYEVSCGSGSGIYMREASHHALPDKHIIRVEPKFHKKTDNNLKIEFNKKLALVSTQSWISCASHTEMNNSQSSFEILLNKSGLRAGCHYGEVQGHDLSQRELGPLFRVPVTIIVAEALNKSSIAEMGCLSYEQGGRKRWFYSVPHGASWARLSLESTDKENRSVRYVVHAMQILPESAPCEHQFQKYLTLNSSSQKTEVVFKVQGGYTMELSLARWWSVSGNSELNAKLSFHGLHPDQQEVVLHGANSFTRVNVASELGSEQISPSASLTSHVIPLSPKEHNLSSLSGRDLLPDGNQVYALDLTYNFNLAASGEVTALVPLLREILYESHFESQFWMIYDSNKSLRGCGDALNISRQKYNCQLEKGDHVVKLRVRHTDCVLLDRMKDSVLNIHVTLPSSIAVDVFSSRTNMLELEKKKMFPARTLTRHSACPVYISTPAEDKLPKGIKPGEHLVGKISFSQDDDAKKVCAYPLQISPRPVKCTAAAKKASETKTPEEEYQEAHQEFLALWVGKLDGTELQNELLQKGVDDIFLKNALLNALDDSSSRTSNLKKIIEVAKEIIGAVDENEILAHMGMKLDASEKACKKKKEVDKQKDVLVNALYKMSLALSDIILGEIKKENPEESVGEDKQVEEDAAALPSSNELDECHRTLLKFIEVNDMKMLMVTVRHGMVHKQYGRSIKALTKYFELNGPSKALYEVYIQLAQSSEWDHVVALLQNNLLHKFPNAYELF